MLRTDTFLVMNVPLLKGTFMTRNVLHCENQGCLRWLPVLTRWSC